MRTTAENIGGIVEVDTTISLTPFITAANALVTEICVPKGYDDERLALIECWLSAHFYCIRDPRRSSDGAGGVSRGIETSVSLRLDVTRYGQMAMLLDTKGGLAMLNKQMNDGAGSKTISLSWLGRTKLERQTSVE